MDPPSIRLVDARRTGQSPLGQRADGHQTLHDGVGILATDADRLGQSLVAVGHRLDGVVAIHGEHTTLQVSNHLGALADGTNILDWDWTHVGCTRLADKRVLGTITANDADSFASTVLDVSGPENVTHFTLG